MLTSKDLVTMDTMCGAFTETQDATEEIQKICDQVSFSLPSFFTTSTRNSLVTFSFIHTQVKCQVEEMTKEVYDGMRAVQYRSQVVAGTNYLIKVINVVIPFILNESNKASCIYMDIYMN